MPIECRHCSGSGTCSTGENGSSCDSCVDKAKGTSLPGLRAKIASTKGLPCGTCSGYGDLEARAWHTQTAIGPALGVIIVAIVLIIIVVIAMASPSHHPQILTLLGTLAGSVVGYYFKGQHTAQKPPAQRKTKQENSTLQGA